MSAGPRIKDILVPTCRKGEKTSILAAISITGSVSGGCIATHVASIATDVATSVLQRADKFCAKMAANTELSIPIGKVREPKWSQGIIWDLDTGCRHCSRALASPPTMRTINPHVGQLTNNAQWVLTVKKGEQTSLA
jgi:hypothetical protein